MVTLGCTIQVVTKIFYSKIRPATAYHTAPLQNLVISSPHVHDFIWMGEVHNINL